MARPVDTGDIVAGALTAVLGGAVLWGSTRLPTMFGFNYGPGFFPGLVGGALLAAGCLHLAAGLVRIPVDTVPAPAGDRAPAAGWLRPLAVLAVLVVFSLAMPQLGFHASALMALTVLLAVFGLGWARAAGLALVLVLAMDAVFRALLLVPLPWGMLTPWSGSLAWRF